MLSGCAGCGRSAEASGHAGLQWYQALASMLGQRGCANARVPGGSVLAFAAPLLGVLRLVQQSCASQSHPLTSAR